jgi:uncharacterized surface protein with fasciclin (FAS1) repeats
MRTSILISAVCALILGVGAVERGTQAMTFDAGTPPQALRVADITTGAGGIQTWTRIMELGGLEDFDKPAQTLFVPSDEAFDALSPAELQALLDQRDRRRAFLAGAATDSLISPEEIAGKRMTVTTLDGRPLTIDATGGELMVGDAEALDVRRLPDGRMIFVLDHALTR